MPIHLLKLIARREVAKGTLELAFSKPENFIFKPGQYAGFTLINPSETDNNGITRRFSLLNIPEDETITIATRIQNSAYKRVLQTMPIAHEIKFAGPTGTFTLHEEIQRPAVMIAGGIGIAPFYSMIRAATQAHAKLPILLFYGNQSLAETAYLAELKALEKQNPYFKLVLVLNNPDAHWKGEAGFINADLIKKYVTDLSTPLFYICGSPVMVTTLQETLAEMEINEENIKIEDFAGY